MECAKVLISPLKPHATVPYMFPTWLTLPFLLPPYPLPPPPVISHVAIGQCEVCLCGARAAVMEATSSIWRTGTLPTPRARQAVATTVWPANASPASTKNPTGFCVVVFIFLSSLCCSVCLMLVNVINHGIFWNLSLWSYSNSGIYNYGGASHQKSWVPLWLANKASQPSCLNVEFFSMYIYILYYMYIGIYRNWCNCKILYTHKNAWNIKLLASPVTSLYIGGLKPWCVPSETFFIYNSCTFCVVVHDAFMLVSQVYRLFR